MNSLDSETLKLKLRIAASPFQSICNSIVKLAANVCETEYALISVKDSHAHLFVSTIGIEGLQEVALNDSFCSYAKANELIEVEDAKVDPRFEHNPYVVGEPFIRFYAGVPISLPLGEQIGTVCVFGNTPKKLSPIQSAALLNISKVLLQTMVAEDSICKQISSLKSP